MSSKKLAHKRAGGHVRIYEEILASPAYRDLKPIPRALLTEFQRIYRRGRNGKLSISVTNAMKLIRASKQTTEDAFHTLVEHGFITMTQSDSWQNGKAREWSLTFEEGSNGQEPTDDWKKWRPGAPVRKLRSKKLRA